MSARGTTTRAHSTWNVEQESGRSIELDAQPRHQLIELIQTAVVDQEASPLLVLGGPHFYAHAQLPLDALLEIDQVKRRWNLAGATRPPCRRCLSGQKVFEV